MCVCVSLSLSLSFFLPFSLRLCTRKQLKYKQETTKKTNAVKQTTQSTRKKRAVSRVPNKPHLTCLLLVTCFGMAFVTFAHHMSWTAR